MSNEELEQLRREHEVLMLSYQEVQLRCTAQMQSLAHQVQQLSQQLIRSRAQLIARDSALAWERELRQTLVAQQLMASLSSPPASLEPLPALSRHRTIAASTGNELHEQQLLENSLQAADLVICQVGCISHNAYWRVKEHCKRHDKPCLFVETPSRSAMKRALNGYARPLVAAPVDGGETATASPSD